MAQAVLLGLSLVPVHAFMRDRFTAGHALTLTAAYGAFWGLQRTALSDFHEVAFAPLLVATAILALSRQQWSRVAIACVALCLTKEDLIPFVGGVGLYLLYAGRRVQGLVTATAAAVFLVLVLRVIIPALNPSEGWAYSGSYGDLVQRPWMLPVAFATPPAKIWTILAWLVPFTFLPMLSPLGALALPIAIGRLLSASESHWGYGGHYSAALAPILAMAAGDALARYASRLSPARRPRVISWVAGYCFIACLIVPGHQPILRLFSARHYRPIPTAAVARQALAVIPAEASVVAQTALTPHLAHRRALFILDHRQFDAEYVIASEHLAPWPQGSADEIRADLEARRQRGYRTVFESNGWIVLQRPGQP